MNLEYGLSKRYSKIVGLYSRQAVLDHTRDVRVACYQQELLVFWVPADVDKLPWRDQPEPHAGHDFHQVLVALLPVAHQPPHSCHEHLHFATSPRSVQFFTFSLLHYSVSFYVCTKYLCDSDRVFVT